jgi:citrate lyase subunit beta/citryl-CoA lyase
MQPIRSFLFVPGSKPTWIEKSVSPRADTLILDLEDSVPPALKAEARGIVQSKLAYLAEHRQRTWVRINRSPHLYDFDDIIALAKSFNN